MRTPAGFVQVPAKAIAAVDLVVCRPPDVLGFIAAAGRGDPHAARIVGALNDALHRVDAAPRHAPLLCATCPQVLQTSPWVACSFVISLPEDEGATHGLALAICRRCASGRAEVRRKAVAALRREMPGLRVVEVTHPSGGRA